MGPRFLYFVTVAGTALYLVPTGAHLFELPGKMALSPAEYMVVQRIYAGWQLFGIAIGIALLSALAQAAVARADRKARVWPLMACLCLAAALADFLVFTYPVNIQTHYWTVTPEAFEAARRQWEYSHAAAALLTFFALIAAILSAPDQRSQRE